MKQFSVNTTGKADQLSLMVNCFNQHHKNTVFEGLVHDMEDNLSNSD